MKKLSMTTLVASALILASVSAQAALPTSQRDSFKKQKQPASAEQTTQQTDSVNTPRYVRG